MSWMKKMSEFKNREKTQSKIELILTLFLLLFFGFLIYHLSL